MKWGIVLLLSFFSIFMGVQKIGSKNVIFATIAAKSGIGLIEPTARIFVCVAELFAAVLLLIPAARFFGALLRLGILFGAIGFHLSPWLGIFVPLEPGGDPAPMLFMMAIFFAGINVVALNLEKARIRRSFPSRPPTQVEV